MRIKQRACFALVIFLICFPVNVRAAGRNSIRIQLKDIGTPLSGVAFQVYQTGSVKNGKPYINSAFHLGDFPDEAYRLDNAARTISDKLNGKADKEGTTDKNGFLIFDKMDDGVYLVRVSNSENYGEISPFLVYLPYYSNGIKYTDITAEPKASVPEDKRIPHTDIPLKEYPTVNHEKNSVSPPVKTGDYTEYNFYLVLFAAAFAFCIILFRRIIKKGGNL